MAGSLATFLALFLLCLSPSSLSAQGTNLLEDEGNDLWGEDVFLDEIEQDPNLPDVIQELEQGGNEYYTEEEIFDFERRYIVQNRRAVNVDRAVTVTRDTLGDNIFYGVGSGVIIGGWLAIFSGGSSRQRFQFFGSGAVLGGLLGFLVGTKAFYIVPPESIDPSAPDPYGSSSLDEVPRISSAENAPSLFSYRFRYEF